MAPLHTRHRSIMLGALLLLHCGGQSTELFDDTAGGGGNAPNAGRGSATGGSTTGGSATGGSATGGSATGGSATGGFATGGSAAGVAGAAGFAIGGSSGESAAGGGPGVGGSAAASGGAGMGATGGVAGSGGEAGSEVGGSSGASAGGEAGLSGSGGESGKGTAGRGSTDCAELRQELMTTLAEARACNIALSSRLSCTGQVVNECGCPVVVDSDDSVASRRYRVLMKQFSDRCSVACPAIVCRDPLAGRCETSGNEAIGTCEAFLGGGR
jgi:hypothetical protein